MRPDPAGARPSAPPRRERSAADRIKADLLLGGYRPGDWLRLVDMEARYGSTRSEIRAALAGLAAVDLLEHVPNRGYRIAQVSEAEASKRTEVRLLLEVPATALVLARATAQDRAGLRGLADRFTWLVENGTVAEIEAGNHAFHAAFFKLCGNERLERLINDERGRASPSGWAHWKSVAANRRSAADHVAMVDALDEGDAPALRRVAFRHVLWFGPPRPGFASLLGLDDHDAA